MSGISIAEQIDQMPRVTRLSKMAALQRRLIFYLFWRLSIVPQIDGIKFFWTSRTKLDGIPYRTLTVPRDIVFASNVTVQIHGPVPMTIGDTLKVTIYQDLPTIGE